MVLLLQSEMNIGLRSILVPQTRFVVMVAISLVLLVSGTEDDLIPLDVLGVMVDFAVRLLGRKLSTRVVREISRRQPSVVSYASNQVISIKPVHGNQGKILVAFVISVIPLISVLFVRRLRRNLWRVHWYPLLFVLKLIVPCRNLFQASCIFSPGQ